ncbi:MAG: hypothetical protein GX815_02260 [Clostridiales bacterium]|nr:hypothetical protein [Clostridiales bacterium]
MFLNYKNRKNSVIYSWIVSYILILAIMVVAISAIYYVARHTIKNEIKSSNELLIGNLKDNMDNTIRNVERFSMEVAYNQNIQNVLTVDERDEGLLQYTLYKASDELRKYKIMDSSLKEYYIYFSELDVVITPKTVYSQDSYFDWYLNTVDNTIDEWLEIMNQKHRGDYLVMPYSDDTQGDKKTVGLVRSFPSPTDENQVVILLDSSALLSSGIDESGERLLLIMDKNNNIIASTGIEDELPGINYKDLRDEHGSINASIDDRNVVVSYTSSQSNDWKFIIITPEDVFWRKSEFLGSIMAGGMLFSILIGVIISYFYLRKNYNPLKDVVRYFQENMHSSL